MEGWLWREAWIWIVIEGGSSVELFEVFLSGLAFLFDCGIGVEPGGRGIVTGDESIARSAASAFS